MTHKCFTTVQTCPRCGSSSRARHTNDPERILHVIGQGLSLGDILWLREYFEITSVT